MILNTMADIPAQTAALYQLYAATTRVRDDRRELGMDLAHINGRLRDERAALRRYIQALRTGIPCPFQCIRGTYE